MDITAAIFDCDGTLVDSMGMWTHAYEWLYDHYFRQLGIQTLDPDLAPILQDARDLLLSNRGDRLDREDAWNFYEYRTEAVAEEAPLIAFTGD